MQRGKGRGWVAIGTNEIELVLLGSKASPGQIERVVLSLRGSERTVRFLRRWTTKAQIRPGEPLFRAMMRGGSVCQRRLHNGSIGVIVRSALVRHLSQDLIDEMMSRPRLERALVALAYVVARHGAEYAPLLHRLEREVAAARQQEASVSRARKLVEAYSLAGARKAMRVSHSALCSSE